MSRDEILRIHCDILAGNPSDEQSAYSKAILKLLEENARLREALGLLRKESAGLIHAHEFALSMDGGNSNMACLQICLDKARAALEGK